MKTIWPLNTVNPNCITWKYEDLLFTVLGGIRLDGLDKMRATLKLESKNLSIRHNLDLYNDTQLERLVKKTAERFEIGAIYLNKAVGEFIDLLEAYRLQEFSGETGKDNPYPLLTDLQKQEAIRFLKQPQLLKLTGEYIGKSGVVGEELNRLIMFLVFTSRKMSRPLHIISMGSSGSGKSHLQEKVGELIPEEDKIEMTALTGNAFYYFEKDELGHKLILIEDLDGVLAALYPIRELQSKQRITKTITIRDKKGQIKTLHLKVQGPVTIAGCTTKESLYEDNANRAFLIYLDETPCQDENIMHYQRFSSAGKINKYEENTIKTLLQNCQRMLEPVKVINPYAEYLRIPAEVFKPRRTNAHYLAFIEAVSFYKQYQKEQHCDPETGGVYIETSIEDIEEAGILMKEVLLRKADELNTATRKFYDWLYEWTLKHHRNTFYLSDIRKELRIHPRSLQRYIKTLESWGKLVITGGRKNVGGYQYALEQVTDTSLAQKIETHFEKMLKQLKTMASKRK